MKQERERKFIVRSSAWKELTKGAPLQMRQAYLCHDSDKSIRVRIYGKVAELTIKIGRSSFERTELEYKIPMEDAEVLIERAAISTLSKHRHTLSYGGRSWDIDIFEHPHDGLILAEVELDDHEYEIDLPDWVGEEVTGKEEYYNVFLAEPVKSQ